jgi:hypothetical protein
VSEESAANAAVLTVEGPGRTQTGFRGAGGEDAGQKNGLGSIDARSAGPKMEISDETSRHGTGCIHLGYLG